LLEKKGLHLSEIDTQKGKDIFKEFVHKWNNDDLDEKYYRGIAPEEQTGTVRTQYRWSFAEKLDPVTMGSMRDSIDLATNLGKQNFQFEERNNTREEEQPIIGPLPPKSQDEEMDENDKRLLEEEKQTYQKFLQKKDLKDYKKTKETVLEELAPKKTGREAMLENKKKKSEYTRRSKDAEMDAEMDDKEVFEGGGPDFHAALSKKRDREMLYQQMKQHEQEMKMKEWKKKEAEKMAPFLALVKTGQIPLMNQKNV